MPKPFTFRPRKRPKGEGCHIYPFIHTYLFLVLKGQEKKDVHNDLYLSEILIQDNLGIFFITVVLKIRREIWFLILV